MKTDKGIKIWLATGCLLIFIMVVVGGITRLTGSGLSITEWKVVTGTIPPLNEEAWQQEFDKYKQIPQYQLINSHFELSDFKRIYFWEYIHRLIGRLIGVVFLLPFIWFYASKRISKELMPHLVVMFMLGALQGFIGWYMVSSGLVANTKVSHYRLALHLGTAFITFGYIYYVILLQQFQCKTAGRKSSVPLLILILIFTQIILGAFVAGTHAGYVYNTWPDMEGVYMPESVTFALQKNGPLSLFDNPASIQFLHRNVAYLITLIIGLWWWKHRNTSDETRRKALNLLLYILLIQVVLGVYTLLSHVPVWMGVTHQALAFVLFAAGIYHYFAFRCKPIK